MTPTELREHNQTQRESGGAKQTPDGFQPLLPESTYRGEKITLRSVNKMSKDDIKQLLRIFGSEQINRRIRETAAQ
jgi:hypothetical protein